MAFSLLSRPGLYRSMPRFLPTIARLSGTRVQCRKINIPADTPRPGVFTLQMPTKATRGRDMTLDVLKQGCETHEAFKHNAEFHDAALVLTSPGLARLVCDNEFLSGLAKTISGSSPRNEVFNLLVGVADRIVGNPNKNGKRYEEGIAIYRCNGDHFIPNLWKDLPPKQKADSDAVAALQFRDLGGMSVTLPLAHTIFTNNKQSTLIAAQYDMSGPSPKLIQKRETYTQDIIIPTSSQPGTLLPLTALTPSRVVTQSFGNIVRGVDVGGEDAPASTELEVAVENVWKIRQESDQSPFPMYAFVSPEGASSLSAPDPGRFGDPTLGLQSIEEEILQNTKYFENAWSHGGRLYQLLSGGGGWGKKKGLLSLDPQTSHFSLSEEDELASFFREGSHSSFAPTGSSIQFFAPHPVSKRPMQSLFTFGVSGPGGDLPDIEDTMSLSFETHFGALSNKAVYVHSTNAAGSSPDQASSSMKISVPDYRIFIATGRGERRRSANDESSDFVGGFMAEGLMFGLLDL